MAVHGRAACELSTSLTPFQPQIISLVSKQSSVHQTARSKTECSPQPQRSPSFLPTGNYAEIRMKESLPHPAVAHPIAVCASKPARALLKKNYFSRS